MPISSDAVGQQSEPAICEIDTRRSLAYAAGIGDPNPRYLDDADEGGVVAPPQLCVSLEWAISGRRRSTPLGPSPDEALRAVHAFQDSTFHRPIRPGDRLRTIATLVEVRAIRPGALSVSRLETVDDRTGEPVVTSYSGAIFRGVAVAGPDRRSDGPTPLPDGPATAPAEKVAIPIAREAPHVYTECARIWNPIHTERRVALAAGLPDIILHGTATWALAGREVVNRFADRDPRRLARLAGRFGAMVIPGTSIALEAWRTGAGVRFEVRNADGDAALTGGYAALRES